MKLIIENISTPNQKNEAMKTVVQKLINKVDAMISNGGDADLLAVKFHLQESIEAEKEQIDHAFAVGYEVGYDDGKYDTDTGLDYYQQTFKKEQ